MPQTIEQSPTQEIQANGSLSHESSVNLSFANGLRLSSLTVAGFKSFADRTTFQFSDPITGIVGPNGCGKSNVVDAIKWVLGERSSKSLRGKEMIDVIFAGSAGRKPAGMASVTLTFDNPKNEESHAQKLVADAGSTKQNLLEQTTDQSADQVEHSTDSDSAKPSSESNENHPAHDQLLSDADADHAAEQGESEAAAILTQRSRIGRPLPIDADTVAVERRLYRDGKSKYIINGRTARLKDIRDLFLDTGIGADAYSIIEQGKVDRMLLASPTERRVIFEEAAGIAKYRQRRVEAQRKLEKTETNLVRTREQLDSTERRLRMVKGQASKARRFKELDHEYRSLRMALAFELYDDIRRRLEGLTSQIASLQDEHARTQENLRIAEEEAYAINEQQHKQTRALREVESLLTKARHQAQTAQQRGEMTVKAIEEAAKTVELETTRLAEANARLRELDELLEKHSETVTQLESELHAAEKSLDEANAIKLESAQQSTAHRQTLDESRATCASIEREHATLLARVQSDDRRLESISLQCVKLSDRMTELEESEKNTSKESNQVRDRIELLQQSVKKLNTELEHITTHEEQIDSNRNKLALTVDELDEQRVRLETRHATLAEMVRSRVGLDDAVREVLDRKESGNGFQGVIGPLAELIEVSAEYASQVESALEDALQSVVVESLSSMPTSDELSELPGRVTFLPLTSMNHDRHPSDLAINQLAAVVGPHITKVRALVSARNQSEQVEQLLDRLLGSTLLVSNLESATLLAAGPLRDIHARFVTAQGTVMEPDGRVCAGPANDSQAAGVLARRAELTELSTELKSIVDQFETKRAELESIDADAARIADQRSQIHASLGSNKQDLVQAQHTLDRHESDTQRIHRDIERLKQEQESTNTRAFEIKEERAQLTDRAVKLEALLKEQQSIAEVAKSELETIENDVEQANDRVSEARVAASTIHEQLRSEQRQATQHQNLRDETERQSALAQRHIERTAAVLDEHKQVAKDALALEQEAHKQIEELEEDAATKLAEVKATAERARSVNHQLDQVRDSAEAFQRDFHAIELAKRETEVKREHIEERTLEDLGMDLVFEYPEYRHMMSEQIEGIRILRIEIDPTQARVNVLKTEIQKLGNVNLNSIEEETNLSERNDDLIAQIKDIDEARIKLATLIEKLNVASRTNFGEVFSSIQKEFGGRNGMFRRLFGGGRAEVRLMPLIKEIDGQKVQTDEIDLLESGIEVIAKPPGKEPRSINQLSGGEKTMTAVAMLLAIFRSKPSCFCVLDEVDAALDEANVGRFCSTLDIFAQQSRFIVITHNKRTMQATDKLFGVTMQERGVSKRVEVRFDQVGEDGHIDTKAVEQSDKLPAPDLTSDIDDESTTESKSKPSGGLRAALASMREQDSSKNDTPVSNEH